MANFLSAVDQKIELKTAILNLLTHQKQYLLTHLFVYKIFHHRQESRNKF
jgi:hypothetical protein